MAIKLLSFCHEKTFQKLTIYDQKEKGNRANKNKEKQNKNVMKRATKKERIEHNLDS